MRRAPYPLRGRANPLTCGRKHCSACGCWRLALDFPVHRRQPFSVTGTCRRCRAREHAERMRSPSYRMARREYHRLYAQRERRQHGAPPRAEWEAGRAQDISCGRKHCTRCKRWRLLMDFYRHPEGRWSGMCQTCKRVRARELYRVRRADANWVELKREYDRIYKEGQRRARGIPERRWDKGRQLPNESHQGWTMEAAPLAELLREWLRLGNTEADLERHSGVPARRMYGILHGERVSVPVADRLVTAMGSHLHLLAAP